MTAQTDRVIRALTDDGSFRVLTIRSTETARAICEAQRVSGETAARLAEVVTGAALVRETMAPGQRLQMVMQDHHGSQLVGDAWPEGRTRGLARLHEGRAQFSLDDGGVLQVVRVLHGGKEHQGVIETGTDVATALMRYFQQSEQIVTMTAVGAIFEGDALTAAGGYVVQLLPELTEPPLAIMTARLEDFGAVTDHLRGHDVDPARLMSELLYGFEHTLLSEEPVSFHCPCTRERAIGALATLGAEELKGLLARGEETPMSCDYCAAVYRAGPDDYRLLLGEDA